MRQLLEGKENILVMWGQAATAAALCRRAVTASALCCWAVRMLFFWPQWLGSVSEQGVAYMQSVHV